MVGESERLFRNKGNTARSSGFRLRQEDKLENDGAGRRHSRQHRKIIGLCCQHQSQSPQAGATGSGEPEEQR